MSVVTCPECDGDIEVGPKDDLADTIECDDCGTELEITGLDPIEVEVVEYDHEDEF